MLALLFHLFEHSFQHFDRDHHLSPDIDTDRTKLPPPADIPKRRQQSEATAAPAASLQSTPDSH
jgi:hypothetical protein